MPNKLSDEDIRKRLSIHRYTLIDGNRDEKGRIKALCSGGHLIIRPLHNLLQALDKGTMCQRCRHEQYVEQIKNDILEEGYQIVAIHDDDTTPHFYFDVICPNGHEWQTANTNWSNGHRCAICNPKGMPFGERVLYNALSRSDYEFDMQVTITDPIRNENHRLDYVVYRPDKSPLIIEYDGQQHFEEVENWVDAPPLAERKRRDQFKNDWAKDNGFDMLRIKYTANTPKKIVTALGTKLNITYDKKFNYAKNSKNSRKIAEYFTIHTMEDTMAKFGVTQSDVVNGFKRVYSMSKSEYIANHPEHPQNENRRLKKKQIADFYLEHTLLETTAKFDLKSFTDIRHAMWDTYGMSKTDYLADKAPV